MSEGLIVERRGTVLEITIDRPKANAITMAMSRRLGELFRDFNDDPDLRVAILTGAGERFFSTGWDLSEARAGLSEATPETWGIGGFGGLSDAFWLTKPVIAAINGNCYGGMSEAVLGADVIIASQTARFNLGEVQVGFAPRATSVVRLLRRVPRAVAVDILCLGRTLTADEALAARLASEILPPDRLMARARELAGQLTVAAPLALRAVKHAMDKLEHLTAEEIARLQDAKQLEVYNAVYASEDAKEGPRAFMEKRVPVWQGR